MVLEWLYGKIKTPSPGLQASIPCIHGLWGPGAADKPRNMQVNPQHLVASMVRAVRLCEAAGRPVSRHPLGHIAREVINEVKGRLPELTAEGLVLFAWAWAKSGLPLDPEVLPALQDRLLAQAGEMEPRHLVMIAYALAHFRPSTLRLRRDTREALEARLRLRAKDLKASVSFPFSCALARLHPAAVYGDRRTCRGSPSCYVTWAPSPGGCRQRC